MATPSRYFFLVFLLSVPFWLLGFAITKLPIPIDLPISSIMAFLPMIVALTLTYRRNGVDGAKALLKRAVDYRKAANRTWLLVALLFAPCALLLAWLAMHLTGAPLPEARISLPAVPLFFAMFLIGAVGEELGWQGYAFDRMLGRWNALEAAVVLGGIWMLWHLIPFFQTHHTPEWVAWHCGVTILLRVITVWLYLNAGRSVSVAILFHTMCNVGYFLFPNYGSHYDPLYFFWILLASAAIIVAVWGPALVRSGSGPQPAR